MQTLTENHKQEITSNHDKKAFNSLTEGGRQIVAVHEEMTYKNHMLVSSGVQIRRKERSQDAVIQREERFLSYFLR